MAYAASLFLRATAILALGFAGEALARRSAALRHRLWGVALAGVVALPLVMAGLPAVHFPWPRGGAWGSYQSSVVSHQVAGAGDAAALSGGAAAGRPLTRGEWPSGEEVLVLAWGLGAAWFLARLGRGWIELRGMARRARSAGRGLCEELRAAQGEMGCAGRVRLAVLPGSAVPQVGGLWRAVIFLPEAAETWPRERLRIALRHELAHVRRGDCGWMLLAGVAQAMAWPHPLVHVAARRMRLASEEACDDAVVNAGGVDRRDYARELVEFARTLTATPAAGAAIGLVGASQLGRRVAALLDVGRRRAARRGALLAATLLGAGAIGLAASAAPAPQKVQAPLPRFAAASVKPASGGAAGGFDFDERSDPVHLSLTTDLHHIVLQAYGLMPKQLGKVPDWFDSRYFAIQAVTAKPSTPAEMMLMLRRLLQQRFHLVLRDEPREMPVYFLEVAPGGVKFHALKPEERAPRPVRRPGYLAYGTGAIRSLVDLLNDRYGAPVHVDRTVVDRTGLTGRYNIELSTPRVRVAAGRRTTFPTLMHDLEAQDGLRLVQGHAKLPYYVVLSATPPTPD